jgi:DNA-directed RNA polymerase specialized sigma24 family protein
MAEVDTVWSRTPMTNSFQPYNDEVFYEEPDRDADSVSVLVRLCKLTDRERSILCANVQHPGLSRREIARKIGVPLSTYLYVSSKLKKEWRCVR